MWVKVELGKVFLKLYSKAVNYSSPLNCFGLYPRFSESPVTHCLEGLKELTGKDLRN